MNHYRPIFLLVFLLFSSVGYSQGSVATFVEDALSLGLRDVFLEGDIVKRSRYLALSTTEVRSALSLLDPDDKGTWPKVRVELFDDLSVVVRPIRMIKGRNVWMVWFEGEAESADPVGKTFVSGNLTLFLDDQVVGYFSSADWFVGINPSKSGGFHFVWEAVDGYTIPLD
jgi:hypothetical protein